MENLKNNFIQHKFKIIIAAIVMVIGFIALVNSSRAQYTEIYQSEVNPIVKKDFVNSVTESGTVVSDDISTIYAEKPLPVTKVHVEIGDIVTAGQAIAKLDDSSVRQQIALKEAMMASSGDSNSSQVEAAQDRLNEAVRNKNQGTNSMIISAESSVTGAYDAWKSAEKAYSDFNNSIKDGYNEAIVASKSNIESLNNNVRSSGLTLAQSQDRLNELYNDIAESNTNLIEANSNIEQLKIKNRDIEVKLIDLQNQLEYEQSNMTQSPSILSELRQLLPKHLTANNTKENNSEVPEEENKTREITVAMEILRISQSELQGEIAELEGLAKTYESEVDANKQALNSASKEVEQQKLVFDTANKNLRSSIEQQGLTNRSMQDQLTTLKKNADDLKNSYNSSLRSLEAAKVAANDEINVLRNNAETTASSLDNRVNDVELNNLYEELDKTIIRAPISGTVTELRVIQGQTPADYVARVETVERTVIDSQVKEFEVSKVFEGMKVEINSDSLDPNRVFTGQVESVNPTPMKTDPTAVTRSNEVLYETKISIDDENNEIQPGMTVRVKYILAEEDDVYTVPTNAIYEKGTQSFILVVDNSEITTIREIEIFPTLENDFETVIYSRDLDKGLRVVNSPANYTHGTEVKIVEPPVEEDV